MLQFHTYTAQELWTLGYTTNQLPIIPPDGIPSPRLAKQLKQRKPGSPDPRGKMPGYADTAGRWHGFPGWTKHQATEKEIASWAASGAGTGLRLGQCGEHHLAFIDVDTMDPALSDIIHTTIAKFMLANGLAAAPRRIGRDPRSGYLIRLTKSESKKQIKFSTEKIEVLGLGQQFVAIGIHPFTKQPYRWVVPLVPIDELPLLSPEQLQQLLDTLVKVLPEAAPDANAAHSERTPNQDTLLGNVERVRLAVKTIPNTKDIDRDQWITIMYAIHAACRDIDDAIEIAQEFSARWQHPKGNDPDYVTFTITGLARPFHVGAADLYRMAQEADPDFDADEAIGDDLNEQYGDWTDEEREKAKANTAGPRIYTVAELWDAPPQQFLIDGIIPEKTVGLLIGELQSYKSFFAGSMGHAICAGLTEWCGHAITAPPDAVVLYIAGEGGASGAGRRMRAWAQKYGFKKDTLKDRFRLITAGVNLMDEKNCNRLIAAITKQLDTDQAKLVLIVVDTINTVAAGIEENSAKEVGALHFVCVHLSQVFDCAVLGCHHTNKAGEVRGSSVLTSNFDYWMMLKRSKALQTRKVTLVVRKLKEEPVGLTEEYQMEIVYMDDGTNSLVPIRIPVGEGAQEEVVMGGGRPALRQEAILEVLKGRPEGLTKAEICELLNADTRKEKNSIGVALDRMKKANRIIRNKSHWQFNDFFA